MQPLRHNIIEEAQQMSSPYELLEGQADRKAGRQKGRQTDRQKGRQKDRQKGSASY